MRSWANRLAVKKLDCVSGVIPFHGVDDGGDWWHCCELVKGSVVAWSISGPLSIAIDHDSGDLLDLYASRSPFDPTWRVIVGGEVRQPLPPWDCMGQFGERTQLLPDVGCELSWRWRCDAPSGETIVWCTSFRAGEMLNEVQAWHPTWTGPSFTFPIQGYLDLRSGGDPLALFDHGGAIEGDLDELMFIAGAVASPTWASRWMLSPSSLEVLRLFFAAYPRPDERS